MAAFATILSIATYAGLVHTIPPPQCFSNFNWNDCGKSPKPVIYYWKPGSRCEVGIWRGCLPNINMFKDEYECVSTCIFTVRATRDNWHEVDKYDENVMTDAEDEENTTDFDNSTTEYSNSTTEYDTSTSVISTEAAGNETVTEDGDTTSVTEPDDDPAGDTTTPDQDDDNRSGEETTEVEVETTTEPEQE